MKKTFAVFCLLVMHVNVAQSQDVSSYNGWAREEELFSQALELTMEDIEKKTPFRFVDGSTLKADFVRRLGDGSNPNEEPIAQYWYESSTVKFRSLPMSELLSQHNKSLYRLDAETLMENKELGKIMWHEAAHHLMNVAAQAEGLGVWYTPEYMNKLDRECWLGVHVVSEGTAEYIKSLQYPFRNEFDASCFPSDEVTSKQIDFKTVSYAGGYWLVRPILKEHGQAGMLWMMRHPFVAKFGGMRQAAVEYQKTALAELVTLEQKK